MQQVSIDGVKKMRINYEAGLVYDAIMYAVNHFNKEKVFKAHKPYIKNEDDIFANFYEFQRRLGFEPSDDLFFFFYFNAPRPNVTIKYLDHCFPDQNYNFQTALDEVKNTEKFKKYTYRYLFEPYKDEVEIEAVLKGDAAQIMLLGALLAKEHPDYAKQVYKLFYGFDDLVGALVNYFELMLDQLKQYNEKKGKTIYQKIVKNFLSSSRVEGIRKYHDIKKSLNLEKQTYAISFFRSFIVRTPINVDNKIIIIGDKNGDIIGVYPSHKNITQKFASSLFTTDIIYDIIRALINKGEKSVLQLSFIIKYEKTYIAKYIKKLEDNSVVYVSRKRGNEFYYKVNYDFLREAQIVLNNEFGSFFQKEE